MSLDQQRDALLKYNILPYRYKSLLRLCIFFHKILNKQILNIFLNSLKKPKYNFRNNNLFVEPSSKTYFGIKRLSVFFPAICKQWYSYLISLSDFKVFVLFNINSFYSKFSELRKNNFLI